MLYIAYIHGSVMGIWHVAVRHNLLQARCRTRCISWIIAHPCCHIESQLDSNSESMAPCAQRKVFARKFPVEVLCSRGLGKAWEWLTRTVLLLQWVAAQRLLDELSKMGLSHRTNIFISKWWGYPLNRWQTSLSDVQSDPNVSDHFYDPGIVPTATVENVCQVSTKTPKKQMCQSLPEQISIPWVI